MTDRNALLKEYFGHETFRQGQEALIDALMSGRDVLGVMPTGAGKSICYQLPAVMRPGVALVISPLISLMQDQVAALRASGISAACINSALTPEDYMETVERARQGAYKILYVAPERLTAPGFQRLAGTMDISLVAVDEAHCVSQWGQDFRPSYLSIAGFIGRLPIRPPVGAFTATATAAVKADIVKLLCLREPMTVTTGFDRPNLFFDVQRPKKKYDFLRDFVRDHPGQSGIVYCATRKAVEDTCERLIRDGISATRYHAGLEDDERARNQEDFVYDRRRVMVATNAFGMGIDKSNVSYVVHFNMPKNLESYYQEAGRAGRDGEKARCVLLFSTTDVRTARFLIENSAENEALSDEERAEVRAKDMERLKHMEGYCRTTGCFRKYLLGYFGEQGPDSCGYCGNCVGEVRETDITVEAQKILSGVARVWKKCPYGLGMKLIMRMLQGGKDQRILELKLNELSTYGIMADMDRQRLRTYFDVLMEQGYLQEVGGRFPMPQITGSAWEVLRGEKRVTFTERVAKKPEKTAPRKAAPDDSLYEALRRHRYALAQAEGVPAYVVFSNAALADMAHRRPADMKAFMRVSGVGQFKAARYGRSFLEVIRAWEEEHA